MQRNRHFNQATSEDAIADFVNTIRATPDQRDSLVELLPERHPLYRGRSTNEMVRLRGYVLAAFERTGLPDAALPFVLDELENGRHAYLVAAAAAAVRGLNAPTDEVIPFLLKAIDNIKYMDDAVTFECYKPQWPAAGATTALTEIFRTFGWLGMHARSALPDLTAMAAATGEFSAPVREEIRQAVDLISSDQKKEGGCCCCASKTSEIVFHEESQQLHPPLDAALEDQDGNIQTYSDFFSQMPAIVVFFYTRCTNPNKCSLTISKLAGLQKLIGEAGLDGQLKTAAITYDPAYDLPPRLKAYGLNRGVVFNDRHRFFRARTGFQELQNYFELGVNFSSAMVNQHRIELFIVGDTGTIAATFARLQWDIHAVLNRARLLLTT